MSIKLIEAFLDGVGKFKKFSVKFKNQVTYLYGMNGSGKTSVGFYGLWACIEGIVQKLSNGRGLIADRSQIIAGKSGDYIYTFQLSTGEKFSVENHITQTGNNIDIIPDKGVTIDDSILAKLFNPALMSAKYFCGLSARDQALALGIDTKEHDKKIAALKAEFTGLNRDMKNIAPIQKCEPVESVNIASLTEKKKVLSNEFNQKYLDNKEHNNKLLLEYQSLVSKERKKIQEFNSKQVELLHKRNDANDFLAGLKRLGYSGVDVQQWIDSIPIPEKQIFDVNIPEPVYIEEMPDRTPIDAIDEMIARATETNRCAENYVKYQVYLKSVDSKQREIDKNKEAQKKAEEERINYINSFSFGFSELSTNENGDLRLKGREIREPYFSGAELEIIVAKLYASMNPDFKYRFIDEFGRFDEVNKKKIVDSLLADGFQLIIAVPDENVGDNADNAVVLRECAILSDDPQQPTLL